ncbi:hypothetical protein like AT3G59200 [Hibiscus trionum]|uniref:F-box domain-containing protein n=1 Tax=Hibiscus trionum TaxID=183268 RepID=A0A9W7GWS1_HIBTR|nr:hypothetical protein like AT3G59200 [Hibiscus trionum]
MKGVDRISDLPDSILSHILSFLSTEEAFRSSFVSARWSNLFSLVSNLNFEFDVQHIVCHKRHNSSTARSFICFVDRVLFFHTGNVDKFRLKCGDRVDADHIYGWILTALKRGVKHLDLSITELPRREEPCYYPTDPFPPPLPEFTLPCSLFTCRTLVSLKLETGFVLDVPKGVHFPNLETLHLYKVKFLNDNSATTLFSGCNALQDVIIEKCNMKNMSSFNISHHSLKRLTILYSVDGCNCWFRIDTPNLAYFTYHGHRVAGYSLENLESIVKADIRFLTIDIRYQPTVVGFLIEYDDNAEADITAFFKGISMATSLSLSPTSLKLLLSCEPLPVFPAMVELRMDEMKIDDFYWSYSMNKGLETLLSRTPELQQLSFNQDLLISLPEQVPSCLLFKLKAIEILCFNKYEDCIRKATYILKNGGALENFTIRTDLDEEGRLNMSKVLLASPRKSNHCKFLIMTLP